MTYSHLTTAELTTIANFFTQGTKAYKVAQMLKRSVETIYRVYRYLKTGATIVDYQQQYVSNKKRCGRKLAQLPQDEVVYINEMVAQGWTPDTIIGVVTDRLVVIDGLFTGCLNGVSLALTLRIYQRTVIVTLMAMWNIVERLVN